MYDIIVFFILAFGCGVLAHRTTVAFIKPSTTKKKVQHLLMLTLIVAALLLVGSRVL